MKVFKTTAILGKLGYKHFGIQDSIVHIYGHTEDEIIELKFIIAEDQSIPDSNDKSMEPDYWGWFDNHKDYFSLIYPKRFLLSMCFPAGLRGTEEHGQGKAYRLQILEK